MLSRFLLFIIVIVAIATPVTAIRAQDQYGTAVGIHGENVLVLKPAAGQGPATLFVYERVGRDWKIAHRLIPGGGRETGERFSPHMTVVGDRLLVGAGDPPVGYAVHEFRQTEEGWSSGERLPLDSSRSQHGTQRQLDMAGLMRIMQPPRRIVAATDDHMVVGVLGGAVGTNGVRVFSTDGRTGSWTSPVPLTTDSAGPDEMFGAAVAISGDRIAVGAPKADGGAVYVFESRAGHWREVARLTPDTVDMADFGSALMFVEDALWIGAPGTRDTVGAVVVFEREDGSGTWTRQAVLNGTEGDTGDGFGASIARSGTTVWIGAPTSAGIGKVYAYEKASSGAWTIVHEVTPGTAEGSRFGSALSATSDLVVVGAPGADGGRGRAAVFEAGSNGWSPPVWLSAGREFETITGREIACERDTAAGFECSNVDLLAFLPIAALGGDAGEGVSDLWGWTDPVTGREYALVGRNGGIAFVDVTNPVSPTYLGELPANRSGARDLKVYRDHLFFTGDGAGNHGLIVFDLSRLRTVNDPPIQFDADGRYDQIASAHNLVIDAEAGFAYPVGASGGGQTCGGGLHMVDIRDPLHPRFAGCYTDTEGLIWPGRTHDGQCVVYRGPDPNYRGKQICFASNETALRIVDVTEKEHPVPIAAATYPGLSYVHQGWLTEDQRYFYLDDELDELVGQANRTRTMVWDVAELDDPVLVGEYFGPDGATDHNLYVKGDRMYQANYQAGMRVIDISDPEAPVEIGYFDTTPYDGNPPGFSGAWTAYPYFESGTVAVTSMREGLFLLRPRPSVLVP